ncbi:hypothetical protein OEA41_008605 [Lepraria neglecta]|uniref:Uncharacterized protein n=1 Tax=Lepraria neglecta TaxID=209136 RepID=A0AAD9Z3E2_9LECA|nr:hypothetical protein OEA41_008605 [Lepraria neglecta]
MPSQRLRLQKGCMSWTTRSDTDKLKVRLLEFYENYNFDPTTDNPTWSFGRDLLPWEQGWLGLTTVGTHEERGKGRDLDAEARNERNDKKRKDIEGKAAAAWPHLRLAAKIPHEDGEDYEQTENRPGKRERQNN